MKDIKILVVDDEFDALELFRDLFSKKGYHVDCVASGIEAIEFINKNDTDVVLLDIKMPMMDGIEALMRIKQRRPNLAVVMLTAYGYDEALVNKSLELGAAGYISKNLPLAQIVNTFETVLSTISIKREN